MSQKSPELTNGAGNPHPESRSIYRGHADSGIGEKRGSTGGYGQQYLYADAELWDESLPDQLRWWTTLDDRAQDRDALGENIEAWSYLAIGELIFTVRLAPAGWYDKRTVFFSHARAWQAEDCGAAFDPGALLGWSEAFEAPWREARPPQESFTGDRSAADLVRRAETVWKKAVQTEPVVAVQFLSGLLEARKTKSPLVIAVPLQEFVEGSALYQLIAFARAALPQRLKMKCRVRIYTGEPNKALDRRYKNDCDLIVIPEDLAPEALAERSDAILLDRRGRNASSTRKIDTSYATAVVERMGFLPGALFAFSARFDRTPDLVSTDAVRLVYNLAAVFPPAGTVSTEKEAAALQMDRDGLLAFLSEAVGKLQEKMPWARLIDASEWKQFSTSALNKVVFAPAETADAREFRSGARTALATRGQIDQDSLLSWWSSVPEERRLLELKKLVEERMLSSSEETAGFVVDLNVSQVEAMLGDPGPAAQDILACVGGEPKWAPGIVGSPHNLPALVALASRSAFWHGLAFRSLETFLSGSRPLPDGGACLLRLNVSEFQPHVPVEQRVNNHLLLAEALERTGRGEGSRAEIAQLRRIRTRGEQRRLLDETWRDERWTALRKYHRPDASWYENSGDLILARPELMTGFEVSDLLGLAAGSAYPFLPNLQTALDTKMQTETPKCTRELRKGGAWLRWRLGTRLRGDELRRCALAWLYDGPNAPVTLEEWKQFSIDLGKLRKEDLDELPRGREGADWPLIKMFEEEQLEDMAKACADLGMLAYLAESFGKSALPYDAALEKSNFAGFSTEILSLLRVSERSPIEAQRDERQRNFSWDETLKLYNHSGHRQDIARKIVADKVLAGVRSESEFDFQAANGLFRECELKDDPYFQRRLAVILCGPEKTITKKMLRWLEDRVPSSSERPSQNLQGLRAASAIYENDDLPRLARFLWPEVSPKSQAGLSSGEATNDLQYGGMVRALCDGPPGFVDWSGLLTSANAYRSDPAGHPFRQLAQAIRNEGGERPIDGNAWIEFQGASLRFSRDIGKTEFTNEPASLLELAGVLSDRDLGEIAAEIVIFVAVIGATTSYGKREWWQGLVGASKACPRRSGFPGADDRLEYVTAALERVLQNHPAYSQSTQAWELREWFYRESKLRILAP